MNKNSTFDHALNFVFKKEACMNLLLACMKQIKVLFIVFFLNCCQFQNLCVNTTMNNLYIIFILLDIKILILSIHAFQFQTFSSIIYFHFVFLYFLCYLLPYLFSTACLFFYMFSFLLFLSSFP